jgi:RNA polymerase sigma-70 factor (sigma-E family)
MMAEVEVSVRAMTQADRDDRDVVLSGMFRESYRSLVGLASLLLDDPGQAEEIVQEAFARTYVSWPRLRDRSDPLPYVRTAVVNLARSGIRRRIVVRRHPPAAPGESPSPEIRVLADEQREEIAAAVAGLPRRQRECVALRYYADLSVAETAAALAISEGTVKAHVHRAMASLAVLLGDDAEVER